MRNFKIKKKLILLMIATGFLSWSQFEIPPIPKNQTPIYDYIRVFSASEKSELEQKLIRYSDSTSTQIVVATIASTEGEYINYLATNWAHRWGIGQKKDDNGVFILLAKKDRKVNISTGYGVEHLLTDKTCSQIIQQHMIPYFKKEQYAKGLESGIDAIFMILNGSYKANPPTTSKGFTFEILMLILIFILILVAISKHDKGSNRGKKARRKSLLDAIILSHMGRGSYHKGTSGTGSYGSGGFGGGFGGGGFGGGGATGGW